MHLRADSKGVTGARFGRECSMHVPLGFTRGKGADSKGVACACFGRECLVHLPLGSAKPFGAQRSRFVRGKRADSKRLREMSFAEE